MKCKAKYVCVRVCLKEVGCACVQWIGVCAWYEHLLSALKFFFSYIVGFCCCCLFHIFELGRFQRNFIVIPFIWKHILFLLFSFYKFLVHTHQRSKFWRYIENWRWKFEFPNIIGGKYYTLNCWSFRYTSYRICAHTAFSFFTYIQRCLARCKWKVVRVAIGKWSMRRHLYTRIT